jgi:hypothetical protein
MACYVNPTFTNGVLVNISSLDYPNFSVACFLTFDARVKSTRKAATTRSVKDQNGSTRRLSKRTEDEKHNPNRFFAWNL